MTNKHSDPCTEFQTFGRKIQPRRLDTSTYHSSRGCLKKVYFAGSVKSKPYEKIQYLNFFSISFFRF